MSLFGEHFLQRVKDFGRRRSGQTAEALDESIGSDVARTAIVVMKPLQESVSVSLCLCASVARGGESGLRRDSRLLDRGTPTR